MRCRAAASLCFASKRISKRDISAALSEGEAASFERKLASDSEAREPGDTQPTAAAAELGVGGSNANSLVALGAKATTPDCFRTPQARGADESLFGLGIGVQRELEEPGFVP